jgi:prepilin-type N-terminal cleavage/methylation domain-containing protein
VKKGFSLIELLVVLIITSLVLGALVALYITHQRIQSPLKSTSDVIEIQRGAIAQFEWLFSRWGTGTPCNDPTGANICTRIRPCSINGNFYYPPPSTLCVNVKENYPCGEIWFYANFEGMAIVNKIGVEENTEKAYLLSCRLKTRDENGDKYCFHIMRHSRFFRDANDNNIVLIFQLNDLDNQNAECIDEEYTNPTKYNTKCIRVANILNGNVTNQQGQLQNWLNLEGGDAIVHLPYLIHLYCENENGIYWLKMKKTFGDINVLPSNCTKDIDIIRNEPPIWIAPVVRFIPSILVNNEEITDTSVRDNPLGANYLNAATGAVKIDITFRNFENPNSPYYRTFRVIRVFGR